MHTWFPGETNFSAQEIVSEFSFSAAPCMLHTHSIRFWTLLPVFLASKLEMSFPPSGMQVKVIACRLVYDLIRLSRMYFATFVNVRRLVLTIARDTSVAFDESERLSSPDFWVALFFAILAVMQALVLREPISLSQGGFQYAIRPFQIWKCTYKQQCNQGIYQRNVRWYCALI